MKYLLDTCVISELIKSKPNDHVITFISTHNELNFFLSVLTIGEIYKGIEKIDDSITKDKLIQWIEVDLKSRFENRIIPLDYPMLKIWGEIQGRAEKIGKSMPVIDSLIATTGLYLDLTVVTRNTNDMIISGCNLLNPWEINDL